MVTLTTEQGAEFTTEKKDWDTLQTAVGGADRIFLTGRTGSGKTTFADFLIETRKWLQPEQKITIAELGAREYMRRPYMVFVQALIKGFAHNSPHRDNWIVVDEVRKETDAFLLASAWQENRTGGVAIVHGVSAESGLEYLNALSGRMNFPHSPVEVDVVVHLVRNARGGTEVQVERQIP